MVRENRIKEYVFDSNEHSELAAIAAANDGTDIYSNWSINGEILDVYFKFNQGGSVALSLSGLGTEFFRDNASSGTNFQVRYPREFTTTTTGSIANAEHVPFLINGPINLTTGSLVSGTAATLQVIVRYR